MFHASGSDNLRFGNVVHIGKGCVSPFNNYNGR